MKVDFDDVLDFLDDLRAEAAADQVDDRIVRISIQHRHPNRTTNVVRITAGYCSLTELRQFSMENEDFGQETSAADGATKIADSIEEECRKLELMVRGGRFEE